METPRTLPDLKRLVDNQIQENVHLDYKASATFEQNANAVRADLGKDVSAFANSDGGVLVIGVVEDKKTKVPSGLDGGVPNATWSRERIEDVLSAAIAPRVDGVEIVPMPASATHTYFAIAVPKSYRAPHQEVVEHRYYKRANFKNQPMEDYEIRDVLSRRSVAPSLINVDVDIRKGVLLDLVVTNIGDAPAENLHFTITPPLPKLAKAKLLTEGARSFAPGKTLRYFFGSAIQEIKEKDAPRFDVEVTYTNPRTRQVVTEQFHFDLSDYLWSAVVESDIRELTKALKESVEKLTREVAGVRSSVDRLAPIAAATGLDLSATTLRNLKRLVTGEDIAFPRYRASAVADASAFVEILGVDQRTAEILHHHALWGEGTPLEDVEGLSADVVRSARSAFDFGDDPVSG